MTDPLSTSHIRQRHILAGDDSPVVLDLVRDVLEEEGYRVTTAAAALDLDEIKRIGPDLVILDHMMADGAGSGWELLREIKVIRPRPGCRSSSAPARSTASARAR